jgi:hypothetical protein
MGPMTGRGEGYCAGLAVPGFMNPMPGRGMGWGRGMGFGRGFGRGRGRGWRRAAWGYPATAYAPAAAFPPYGAAAYVPPVPREDELQALQTQADYFTSALEEIRKRIEELKVAEKQE